MNQCLKYVSTLTILCQNYSFNMNWSVIILYLNVMQGTITLSIIIFLRNNKADFGGPAPELPARGNPTGYRIKDNLRIGVVIQTEDKGPIDGIWRKGGDDITDRGDEVIWGYFYASPDIMSWGSEENPDLFVKIWFDVSGNIYINYFHASVPNIEVYSDYPNNGKYDQKGTTTNQDRYIRHSFCPMKQLKNGNKKLDYVQDISLYLSFIETCD